MDTNELKRFAQAARNLLIDQVTNKLAVVLDTASIARREHPEAMKALDAEIANQGKPLIVEKVAYTWFNRFTALRFMDVNGYTNPRVVSPAEGATRPEILAEAMTGNLPDGASATIAALLDGRTPSNDPQAEAYRLLLVHACNLWHGPMPFLFEQIDDYSELLMPEDLLSPTSILARMRDAMTEDACKDVEIIGWLYQFYISEKKEQVFAGLKKNIKITAENIPAATQLFTPHWIVRYLVENSLGRLWLLNRPQSKLAAQMDYYIAPEDPETNFLRISRPEDIRICDPAAGSGHMLTYAFDLLHAIYEEEGYEADEIPALILTHNLHGVEIDDRAGALAAFALVMKAAARLGRRRFLRLEGQPRICVMQDVRFTPAEMQDVAAVVGRDLFTAELQQTLAQFEQAKNFGSLIVPKLSDPAEVARVVWLKDFGGDLLLRDLQARVLKVLEMAEALSPKYHVVVANPPYMGGKGMNSKLQAFARTNYASSKSDLFAMFITRGHALVVDRAFNAMVTMEAWMFLSSYELLRLRLIEEATFLSLLHMPYEGKGRTSMGINFGTVAFVTEQFRDPYKRGFYTCIRHTDLDGNLTPVSFPASAGINRWLSTSDFDFVPHVPISYGLSDNMREAFRWNKPISEIVRFKAGLLTGDNPYFQKHWAEVEYKATSMSENRCSSGSAKWFPCHSGGDYRKWYGNHEVVVNWEHDGLEIRNFKNDDGKLKSRPQNTQFFFRKGITYSKISSGRFDARYRPEGFIFDDTGRSAFSESSENELAALSFLCSSVSDAFLSVLCPTLSFNTSELSSLPLDLEKAKPSQLSAEQLIEIARSDWDAYETSWDFSELPLIAPEHRADTLADSYSQLRAHWQGMTDEMQRLEEENNRIFIGAYGLQDELTPEVPLEEITLTCNPSYRYGGKASAEELETRLRADTMAEFLHYAVGCMFGRYSLDAPGLILANQGEGLADYLARVPEPSFDVDADDVIPVLEGDWFADDIVSRFQKFLRVTFGEAKYQENLAFIETALGKDIRKWFTKDFFEYHVRRYKKRPIYWMFSSPKGSFNALIYMHRYRPDTVSVVLNDYLREFISKLQAERGRLEKLADDPTANQAQRTKALKDVGTVIKQIDELEEWERDVVFPLAQAKLQIDLDDGVKRNYPKFGAALKPIKGLESADE